MNKRAGDITDEEILRLLGLLYRTERTAEGRFDVLLQPVGLTCTQYHVLKILTLEGEPMQLGQIAEKLHSVRSNATQLVDRLVAEGLVERVYDPADRRRVLAQVTDEGRRRYNEGVHVVRTIEQDLLTLFTSDERRELIKLLSRLEVNWK